MQYRSLLYIIRGNCVFKLLPAGVVTVISIARESYNIALAILRDVIMPLKMELLTAVMQLQFHHFCAIVTHDWLLNMYAGLHSC